MQASVTGRPPIPAMTTDAERECYYRLAMEAAGNGAIIELGAWLGASTAYIAAGIRDSGANAKAHVYDKFQSKPAHAAKVKLFFDREGIDPIPVGHARKAFESYLGPLLKHVEVHEGQIETIISSREPIALMVTDAPKRVKAISAVLTRLRKPIVPGTVLAWQDFGHFPSYEIPACLWRIRKHIEVVEAIVPGTTVVFRVKSQWHADEVSEQAFALKAWTPQEIDAAWAEWLTDVPAEKAALFRSGQPLFLCDIGHADEATLRLKRILDDASNDVLPKWRYLHSVRPDLVARYKPLFDLLEARGML